MTDKDRLLTDDTIKSRTVVEFASGKGHSYLMTLISSEDSAHDFIVKFSPSVCAAVVASLTGEEPAWNFAYQLMEQILLLSMDMTKQQCMHARSGLLPGDKHLTSFSTGRKFRPVSNFT